MPLFLSLHSESKWPPAYLHTLHMRPIAPSCSNMRWRITCKHIQGQLGMDAFWWCILVQHFLESYSTPVLLQTGGRLLSMTSMR